MRANNRPHPHAHGSTGVRGRERAGRGGPRARLHGLRVPHPLPLRGHHGAPAAPRGAGQGQGLRHAAPAGGGPRGLPPLPAPLPRALSLPLLHGAAALRRALPCVVAFVVWVACNWLCGWVRGCCWLVLGLGCDPSISILLHTQHHQPTALFELQARWIAQQLAGQSRLPSRKERFAWVDAEKARQRGLGRKPRDYFYMVRDRDVYVCMCVCRCMIDGRTG